MIITVILLILHIITAFLALQSRNLIGMVIFMAVFSLLSSLLYFHLHAPDVALTEATVGAGISTFIYVWIIFKTGRRDET